MALVGVDDTMEGDHGVRSLRLVSLVEGGG
jgi:hypothetical protein